MILSCTICAYVVPRDAGSPYPPPGGCKGCGGSSYTMQLADAMPVPTDELLLHGRSISTDDEILLVVTSDGSESRHAAVTRGAGMESRRRSHHTKPYRQAKVIEEVEAAWRLLPAFNSAFQTTYNSVEHEEEENHPVDVWAVARDGTRLGIQVTKPDTRVWRDLARGRTHEETVMEVHFLNRLAADVVRVKGNSGSPDIVLVLDGWGVLSPGAIQRLRDGHHAQFAALRFHSVWFCNRGPAAAPASRVDRP